MPRYTTYEIADRLLKGKLEDHLKEWRSEKLNLVQCADNVMELTGVPVSRETIRRWLLRIAAA